MKIGKSTTNLWSKLGSRATYGQVMNSLPENNDKVLAISADLGNSSGLAPFIRKHPDKFFNVGIAEQNMIGFAAGLAKEGYIPFVSSFAPFLSMRASEQIRMELGYMRFNVKVVALGSGLAMSFLGNSHYGLEDVSVMRSIPGLCIISPADCTEIVKCVQASAEYDGPVYIRLTGATNNPIVYTEDYEFKIGKSITLREGSDISIVAAGTMVHNCLEAAKLLSKKGIESEVVNMHTIKPLDEKKLKELINKDKFIFSVEEHTVVGGLGSSIAEFMGPFNTKPPLNIFGLQDKFGPTAEHGYLIDYHGLSPQKIADRILKKINE